MTSRIRGLRRSDLTHGIVQISLDLKSVDEALRAAAIAMEAGADWLEIGTPLALSEGTRAVRRRTGRLPGAGRRADFGRQQRHPRPGLRRRGTVYGHRCRKYFERDAAGDVCPERIVRSEYQQRQRHLRGSADGCGRGHLHRVCQAGGEYSHFAERQYLYGSDERAGRSAGGGPGGGGSGDFQSAPRRRGHGSDFCPADGDLADDLADDRDPRASADTPHPAPPAGTDAGHPTQENRS